MMIQTTWSSVSKAPDPNTDKSQFLLPSQLSIFYAGRISDNMGAFVQITAENGGGFSQDNTDIRFANTTQMGGTSLAYGLSLNNNPTVQDPWNSTPAWGYPWFEAGYGYAYPHPMLESMGGLLAGLSAYGFWDSHLYTELGFYTAANSVGRDGPANGGKAIKGEAPYWRLAYTGDVGNVDWEVGTYGMQAEIPTNGFDNARDKFTDTALDFQVEWIPSVDNTVVLDGNYTHERQSLDATSPHIGSQHQDTMKVDLTWYLRQTWGLTVGYRGGTSSDNAVTFTDDFGADGIVAATGIGQDADALEFQLDYTPWLNTRFSVQYTDYLKLNGTSDGASDNNQLMLGAWLLF
jgi:hypothetical protein